MMSIFLLRSIKRSAKGSVSSTLYVLADIYRVILATRCIFTWQPSAEGLPIVDGRGFGGALITCSKLSGEWDSPSLNGSVCCGSRWVISYFHFAEKRARTRKAHQFTRIVNEPEVRLPARRANVTNDLGRIFQSSVQLPRFTSLGFNPGNASH